MSQVTYTKQDHHEKATRLDMMLRLAHADWLEMLIEWAEICMSETEARPIFRGVLWKNFNKALAIVEVFGDDLAQDFHQHVAQRSADGASLCCQSSMSPSATGRLGHADPIKWWHENIGAIGMRSDNEMVQELTMEYFGDE